MSIDGVRSLKFWKGKVELGDGRGLFEKKEKGRDH